jgi:hypothetical protein
VTEIAQGGLLRMFVPVLSVAVALIFQELERPVNLPGTGRPAQSILERAFDLHSSVRARFQLDAPAEMAGLLQRRLVVEQSERLGRDG